MLDADHRLARLSGKIYNRQPTMAKAYITLNPMPLGIWPPMGDGVGHHL